MRTKATWWALPVCLMLGTPLCSLRADIVEKKFTRASDGKTATGQVFVPTRKLSSRKRSSRSSRRVPIVSPLIVPSLTPAKVAAEKKTPAPAKPDQPRFGFGSETDKQGASTTVSSQQTEKSDSTHVVPSANSQPIYVFSPRYNSNYYWPTIPYYGYRYNFGRSFGFGCRTGGHHIQHYSWTPGISVRFFR